MERRHRATMTDEQARYPLAELLEHAPANIWRASPKDFRRVYVSAHAARMTGHPSSRWLEPDFWRQHVHSEDRERVVSRTLRALENGERFVLEYRLARADGRYMVVRDEVAVERDAEGRAVALYGVMSDLSELRAAHESLRRSEERMRLMIESSRDYAIFTADLDGRITSWNAGAESLTGWREEEVLGKEAAILFTPEDREHEEHIEEMRRALRVGRSVNERWHMHKSGRRFWGSGLLMPLKLDDGTAVGFTKIMRDGTEQMRTMERARMVNSELELRVAERTAQLESANRELESFSYSVSHDLHAPLRKIDGYSRTILEEDASKLDDRGRARFEKIRAASRQMSTLIDDLLSLARVVRGEMREDEVDLSGLALEIGRDLARSGAGRGVELRVAPRLKAKGDPHLLRLALYNLLDNAWKFSSKAAAPVVEFGAMAGEEPTVFFVRDNGAGFDMAYASKLFREFSRLHDPEAFPGTGIGLATVKRIVRRHGGRIWAEGRLGHGAAFYFTLAPSGGVPSA